MYSSRSLDLFSVRPTATEIRDARRVRSVDLVDYRVLPGRPGVIAVPVPYSQNWTLDGHPAIRLADGQAGIVAPAGGGVVHYNPSGGVIASEIASLAAALALAGITFLERRKRVRGRTDPGPSRWQGRHELHLAGLARRRANPAVLAESALPLSRNQPAENCIRGVPGSDR